jgi:hypothetical protein
MDKIGIKYTKTRPNSSKLLNDLTTLRLSSQKTLEYSLEDNTNVSY